MTGPGGGGEAPASGRADAEDAPTETGDDGPLIAVVEKENGDAAIDRFHRTGVYDDTRRLVEYDDDHLAVPVVEPPGEGDGGDGDVVAVRVDDDPEYRGTGLDSLLRDRGWDDEAIAATPNSWAVLGSVVLANFEGCPREGEVGEALLELHGEADTVLAREGIDGRRRQPEVRVVAGEGDTETVHREHGIEYAVDLAEVMFSPGNKAERRRMGAVVAGEEPPAAETGRDGAERVFDMFAGIGYFALPMADAGARVIAAELNPTAFRYLLENAALNGVRDRLAAYRGDCREVADRHFGADGGDADRVDRVVMGHYDAPEYLDAALPTVAPGGVVHCHAVVPEECLWDRPLDRVEAAAADAGREVEVLDRRTVKTHSEGVWHAVVDARID